MINPRLPVSDVDLNLAVSLLYVGSYLFHIEKWIYSFLKRIGMLKLMFRRRAFYYHVPAETYQLL